MSIHNVMKVHVLLNENHNVLLIGVYDRLADESAEMPSWQDTKPQ